MSILSLVYPFLIYAIPIWGVACENIINPLYVLQKRVVRIITNKEGVYWYSWSACTQCSFIL